MFKISIRQSSLSSVQSLAANQAGIFKTLSESTPVEYCQDFLVNFHAYTGLPWWATIILSTILIRSVVTVPLAIYQQSIAARLENLKLEMPDIANELKKEIGIAVRLYNWDERTARINYNRSIRKQWNHLVVRDNCHPLKTTVLLWVQLPLWLCLSISYRNLVYMLPHRDLNAQLTFAELMGGGFAFIPNLTIPDASWIFPIGLGLLNLVIIELQLLSRNPDIKPSRVQKIFTNVFRVLSVCLVPIAASVPSCLVLYWTTSSAFGMCQNLILLSPKVKRLFGIPKTAVEVKEPYKMIVTNFKSKLKM
ncbi:cytochrome c oxidase assembly protein COX18, mitochondrial isoform X2 [Anthonomus grandis grandis]|uniref:cytochrome c oxidase assembly protein COX18, mitochondrial isoform X2 n=1 Tax=Anthonomus grandis grandis TaxID=2921223 RepID=UPI0021652B3A|nr:cytochrome c oxidase assembly protein COX18, mitochondrial isoform X2 [Anthonomus grandis grandis]